MGAMQDWIAESARVRAHRGTVRYATTLPGRGADLLDLASNDYLGLSTDFRLKAAAIRATERYGTGARASRVVTGTLPVHLDLEHELCTLTEQPAALVFSSGYTANLAILTALGGPGALILHDAHVHASLIDAARLSRSPVEVFPHSDLEALQRALRYRTTPRAIVVVESVYSVLGDAAPLGDIAALCAEHDAMLVVDEAHGIGVVGDGRGGVHAAGLAGAAHVVITVTLSKALGAQGGAVLGSAALREHLVNTARSFLFDTGLAPAPAGAAAAACRVIGEDPGLTQAVHRNAALIAEACGVPRSAGAVQSILVGTPERADRIRTDLLEAGVLVGCFRPPSVPDGISRLRLTANASLEPTQMLWACGLVASMVAEKTALA